MVSPMESQARPSQTRESFDSDASSKNLSAIHGNFIPLQSSEGLFLVPPRRTRSPHRLRSRSPRRRQDQGVHLHLSLTDSQMDKLASTITNDEPAQPKGCRRANTTQDDAAVHLSAGSKSSVSTSVDSASREAGHSPAHLSRGRSHHGKHSVDHGCLDPDASGGAHRRARSDSPSKHWTVKSKSSHQQHASTNSQSRNSSPASREHGVGSVLTGAARSIGRQLNSDPQVPVNGRYAAWGSRCESPSRKHRHRSLDDPEAADTASSVYSDDLATTVPQINPLYIRKIAERSPPGPQTTTLQEYAAWATGVSPMSASDPFTGSSGSAGSAPRPGRQHVETQDWQRENMEEPQLAYSPLASLSNEAKFASMPKGRKVLVGQNGWLERPNTPHRAQKRQSPDKKGGFLDTLKRMAKEVAEVTDIKSARRARDSDRGRRSSRVRISLDPREQSLLYCELEFLLTSALDAYINNQFNAGRLDADKYKKVVDAWLHKGRPKVVGFRFDLETQLDLVHLHVDEFRFYGERAGAQVAIAGILEMMKVNARAMRIRTFCQPDSAIAKQLMDSQSLLNVVGSAEPRQVQLAEVVQFFKIVLERENSFHPSEGLSSSGTVRLSPTNKSLHTQSNFQVDGTLSRR